MGWMRAARHAGMAAPAEVWRWPFVLPAARICRDAIFGARWIACDAVGCGEAASNG